MKPVFSFYISETVTSYGEFTIGGYDVKKFGTKSKKVNASVHWMNNANKYYWSTPMTNWKFRTQIDRKIPKTTLIFDTGVKGIYVSRSDLEFILKWTKESIF